MERILHTGPLTQRFVMEKDSEDGIFHVTMRYMHSMVRDINTASNEYGRSGFCRRGVYGMPTHLTNTMRVCTRDATDIRYDASVPVKPQWSNEGESRGEEYCAESPYDVPWSIDDDGFESTHPGNHSMVYNYIVFSMSRLLTFSVYLQGCCQWDMFLCTEGSVTSLQTGSTLTQPSEQKLQIPILESVTVLGVSPVRMENF